MFKIPSTFPDKGIEELVLSSPTIEYMAEFYDQAVEFIREELGPSDPVMKLINDTLKVPPKYYRLILSEIVRTNDLIC